MSNRSQAPAPVKRNLLGCSDHRGREDGDSQPPQRLELQIQMAPGVGLMISSVEAQVPVLLAQTGYPEGTQLLIASVPLLPVKDRCTFSLTPHF